MDTRHSKLNVASGIHTPISYIYANEAARIAATGFTIEDGYKFCYVVSTELVYCLSNYAGPTWVVIFNTSSTSEFYDMDFRIFDNSDNTKKIAFEASTITTGTTRTITVPDANVDLGNLTNANISASAIIDLTKLQTVTTDRLIGRDTAGTGTLEQISLNSTLEFNGSNQIQRAALTGDVTATAGSNTTTIANNAVTLGKIQQIATDSLLGRDTAGTGNVQSILLNSTLSMDGSGNLQRSAITGDVSISAGSNSSTVTDLTIASEVQGSVIYYNGTNWVQLSPGTSGQVLQTQGAAANPIWATVSAGGNTFLDSLFRIQDNGDNTKQIAFEASGIATATTRTITVPNSNVDLGALVNANIASGAAINLSKLESIATSTLVGNPTGGGAVPSLITLNSTLSFTGTTLQRAALTGDVTATAGSNATTIANDAVTTAKILNNNVTFAKFQQITTDRLLGRDTAATGNVEEISLDSTLVFSGTSSIGRSAISGDITIAAGSNTASISSNIITNADINTSAGINLSKLETIAASTLVGNPTGLSAVATPITINSTLEFSAGVIRRAAISGDVTIAAGSNTATVTDLTISGETNGDMLYYNGTNWVRGSNVTVTNNDLTLVNNASPVAPSAGCKLYSNTLGNRVMPWVYADGYNYPLQGAIFKQPICYIMAAGSNISGVGSSTSALGTASATGMGVASTNIFTRMRKVTFNSSAAAGSFSALRNNVFLCLGGNGSGNGGFYFHTRFAAADPAAVSGVRQFVGLRNSTAAPTNVEPDTITNCVGLAQLSTDSTQYYIVYGGSAAQTEIATGIPIYNGTPNQVNGVPIELSIYSKPGENSIFYYEVINMSNNTSVTGTLSGTPGTTTPASSTTLTWHLWRCNNATALQCNVAISTIYLDANL